MPHTPDSRVWCHTTAPPRQHTHTVCQKASQEANGKHGCSGRGMTYEPAPGLGSEVTGASLGRAKWAAKCTGAGAPVKSQEMRLNLLRSGPGLRRRCLDNLLNLSKIRN